MHPELFIREGPGPTNKVLTTFINRERESPMASRGGGIHTSILTAICNFSGGAGDRFGMTFHLYLVAYAFIILNSIYGFLTNSEIFLSLWPLHDNDSLSYTPFLLLGPKNIQGVLNFEDHLIRDKVYIKHPIVYFLLSESTLQNSRDIYAIRHFITKIIGT